MGRARVLTMAAALAVLAALGLVVSGCGGSGAGSASGSTTTTGSASTTTTAGTGTGGPNGAALSAFQTCLKAHGVTLAGGFGGRRGFGGGAPPTGTDPTAPPPTGTTPGGTNGRPPGGFGQALTAKQRAAFQACQSKLPAGARGGAGGFRRGGAPGAGGASPAFAKYTACLAKHGVKLGASAAGSTTFAKAQAACRKLLPTPGAGGTGTATTTTATG